VDCRCAPGLRLRHRDSQSRESHREWRCANHVDDKADELEHSEAESEAHGIPELRESIENSSDLHHVYDAFEEQEQHGQSLMMRPTQSLFCIEVFL